jgi:hypothetical protein
LQAAASKRSNRCAFSSVPSTALAASSRRAMWATSWSCCWANWATLTRESSRALCVRSVRAAVREWDWT